MQQQFDLAVSLIRSAGKVIALTGAGVSTESGIPDFRSRGGLWSRFDPMEYGTLGAFRRDPEKVWTMLAELLSIADAQPNKGHLAMAEMEKGGYLDGIITQNVDGLHRKAGNHSIVEFHGSLATFSCLSCHASLPGEVVRTLAMPPRCRCGEVLKPDIIFFDEAIPARMVVLAEKYIRGADVLIVAGTSCQVEPAASIPLMVKQRGGAVIELNSEPVLGGLADVSLGGKFAGTMSRLVAALDI